MTDAASFTALPRIPRTREASLELPAPQPFGLPVLIGDCATPLAGETVLSLIHKRIADDDG